MDLQGAKPAWHQESDSEGGSREVIVATSQASEMCVSQMRWGMSLFCLSNQPLTSSYDATVSPRLSC
jgi:hypothetical protein